MADKSDNGSAPPYVAFKTFKTLLRMIAPAMPSRIDKHVMPTFSGANRTQVVQALKYLGLVDELGVPKEKLYNLVKVLDKPEEYAEAMFNLLDDAYPFLRTIDHTTATDGQINEAFAKVASGDTVRKCKSFWLAAMKDAGAELSPYIKEPGKRGPSPSGKRTKTPKEKKTSAERGSHQQEQKPLRDPSATQLPGLHPALAGLLHDLPKPGTAMARPRKQLLMNTIAGIFDLIYPDE